MNLSENMKALGYSEEEIKKVKDNPEYENFAKILDGSNSFEEAVKKFEDMYQDFDAAKFREACESQAEQKDDVSDDSEEILDLEDDALEAVAGGSIGSFFKKNWKTITGAVVGGVAGAGDARGHGDKDDILALLEEGLIEAHIVLGRAQLKAENAVSYWSGIT